jgi:hypothetical protein
MGKNIRSFLMIGKYDIDDAKKARIIEKAGLLGVELGPTYGVCAPITFAAVCEAFRSENIELFTPEVQEMMIQGMMGLHSGVAFTGVGTCGAITSSSFLIASVVGVGTKDTAQNSYLTAAPAIPIVEDIIDRFEETYGAIDCLKLRYNRVQRAFDFLDPDAIVWETLFALAEPKKCGAFCESYKCGSDQCIPGVGARWAAESICDLLRLEPEERKQIPPHLEGYNMKELVPKVQKVAALMQELGIGQPKQKISWREYRKFKQQGKKGVEQSRPCGADAPEK